MAPRSPTRSTSPSCTTGPARSTAAPTRGYPCYRQWLTFTVLWDGRVALCCADFDGRVILGDLRTSTIREVWNGERVPEDPPRAPRDRRTGHLHGVRPAEEGLAALDRRHPDELTDSHGPSSLAPACRTAGVGEDDPRACWTGSCGSIGSPGPHARPRRRCRSLRGLLPRSRQPRHRTGTGRGRDRRRPRASVRRCVRSGRWSAPRFWNTSSNRSGPSTRCGACSNRAAVCCSPLDSSSPSTTAPCDYFRSPATVWRTCCSGSKRSRSPRKRARWTRWRFSCSGSASRPTRSVGARSGTSGSCLARLLRLGRFLVRREYITSRGWRTRREGRMMTSGYYVVATSAGRSPGLPRLDLALSEPRRAASRHAAGHVAPPGSVAAKP